MSLVLSIGSVVGATPITIPTGLNPNDEYRLMFVTQGVTTASGPGPEYYRNFARLQAMSEPELVALNTEWYPFVSVPSVDARTMANTFPVIAGGTTGLPIFGLDGLIIAENYNILCDNHGRLSGPINRDQYGNFVSARKVWTGTGDSCSFASDTLGEYRPMMGTTDSVSNWLTYSVGNFGSFEAPVFVISGILKVPQETPLEPDEPLAPVPEPTTWALVVAGLVVVFTGRLRRK